MPLYRYKAVTRTGSPIRGTMDAANEAEVISRLQDVGHLPVSAKPAGTGLGVANGNTAFLRRRTVSIEELAALTQQLSRLLTSGVNLERALEVLSDVTEAGHVQRVLTDVLDGIRGGSSLADSMNRQGGVFTRSYISTVRAGEAGGSLGLVLERLADYLAQSLQMRREVRTALTYPAILFGVSVVSVMLLLMLVVPQFTAMFDRAGSTMPYSTQIVVAIAGWTQQYWWTLLLGFLVLVFAAQHLQHVPNIRRRFDAFVLALPVVGDLIRKLEVARFARTLGTLLANGVTLLTALSIVRETLKNRIVGESVAAAIAEVKEGRGLGGPLSSSPVFPRMAVHMVLIGEETGRLEQMLMDLATMYDQETRQRIKSMLTVLEPALVLGMGVIMGGIIISILVAILSVNQLAF